MLVFNLVHFVGNFGIFMLGFTDHGNRLASLRTVSLVSEIQFQSWIFQIRRNATHYIAIFVRWRT
jgi:hypothetical protein